MGGIAARLFLLVLLCALGAPLSASGAAPCTHYASPGGTGSGVSPSQPFQIADFWRRAKPGYVLCLMDGRYTGGSSMIDPPDGLDGAPGAPITVRALHDGAVTISGRSTHFPVRLRRNDYFVLEGFNAHDSKGTVVELSRSSHNILRRIAAWDAAEGNHNIFGIHRGTHNLLEDVAGWGTARKVFSASQGGDYTTIRRAWGRWEGSHVVGPKMTFSLAYNNQHLLCENCIGTWSGERMKETAVLMNYYGQPWTGSGAGVYRDYGVNQPYGIFAVDRLERDKHAHARLLGSIAYARREDRFAAPQAIFVTKLNSLEISHTVVYLEPGAHESVKRFALHNLSGREGSGLLARHLTGIGGAVSVFGSAWQKTNVVEGATPGSVSNVFTSAAGARLCHRYRDGVLTTEPLWPWPMNHRIAAATTQSGRAPVDVTRMVESMFGKIPPQCRADP